MGSWGAICTFDRQRFLELVVPAFHEGERSPIIAHELAFGNDRPQFELPSFEGLREVMATYDHELVRPMEPPWPEGADWTTYDLVDLFERVVLRYCVDAYAWMGRCYRVRDAFPTTYDDDGENIPSPALMELVEHLDTRWRCWEAEYNRGFSGWLDADDARAFAILARHAPIETYEGSSHASYHARVCALAERAAQTKRGLLWGIDLRLVYDGWDEYDLGRHPITLIGNDD